MASPFIPFDGQYSAHTDVTLHPVTGVAYITVAFHPNNAGPFNCRVWELRPPYTGDPVLIRDWTQGQYSVGPFGHGASVPLPTGALLTVVPVAGNSAEVKPSLYVDVGASPPYALGSGGTPGPQGPPGPAGTPADPGALAALAGKIELLELAMGGLVVGGGVSAEDRAALDWVRALRALLRG